MRLFLNHSVSRISGFVFLLMIALMLTGCNVYDIETDIPDAENVFFSDTGRLFVSGGTNIFELTQRTDGSFNKEALDPAGGNFTGITQVGDYLYTLRSSYGFFPDNFNICDMLTDPAHIAAYMASVFMDKELLWMDLNDPTRTLYSACTLNEFLIPNGMVADENGFLYIADETFLPMGQIVRAKVTHLPDNQASVERGQWMNPSMGCISPNGMAIKNQTIYFTDFVAGTLRSGRVKKVTIDENSGDPVDLTTLHKRPGLFDDLAVCRYQGQDGVAATDFVGGSVVFISEEGAVIDETPKLTFSSPSAVAVGQGQGFGDDTLLVTEKGIMFDHVTGIGNKLSGMSLN